jgi:hypothetical protein
VTPQTSARMVGAYAGPSSASLRNLCIMTNEAQIAADCLTDRIQRSGGIAGLVSLRDGKELAKLPRTPVGKFGRPLIQSITYHDTSGQPVPEMRYLDTSARSGEDHANAVITVSSVGLESEAARASKAQTTGR